MMTYSNSAQYPYSDLRLDDLPNEQWEYIPGFVGYFMVSNFGRIKRLARGILDAQGGAYTFPEAIRQAVINKDRNLLKKDWTHRLQIVLQFRKKKYSFQVARLVYYCFVENFDMNDRNLVITYRNGDGLDIRPENLLLVTYHERNTRSYQSGRLLSHIQTSKFKLIEFVSKSIEVRSVMVSQYDTEGDLLATFKSITEASRRTGIPYHTINQAYRKPARRGAGFYWREGAANKINKKEIREYQEKARKSHRQKTGEPVTQLDLQGNILASYCAKSVAAKITGISHRSITQHIQGLISNAGGFIWKSGNLLHTKDAPFQSYQLANTILNGKKISMSDCMKRDVTDRGEFSKGVKVTQFNKDGEPIARFNTIKAAADAISVQYQRIALALQGKAKTVNGYIWRAGHHYQNIPITETKARRQARKWSGNAEMSIRSYV